MSRSQNRPEIQKRAWQIICGQERSMISEVDAIRVSGKPEVIGGLFEDNFRDFLKTIVPRSISVVPGFIVRENGEVSSHFDVLLVDNAYPFLAAIGPHRYVMAASVVGAVELTTMLDRKKLTSIIGKATEIDNINADLYENNVGSHVGFYAVCVDSHLLNSSVKRRLEIEKPLLMLSVLRGKNTSSGFLCWVEGGKGGCAMLLQSTSPLADFIYMHLQDNMYCLSSRTRNDSLIGARLNNYIRWGTAQDQT